jgi:hypothetical protein
LSWGAVAEPEAHRARLLIATTHEQKEQHLLQGVRANLLLHPVVARVDLDPDPVDPQLTGDVLDVVHLIVGDRRRWLRWALGPEVSTSTPFRS